MSDEPRYLGLDIGTSTGWAVCSGNKIVESGVRDFTLKSKEARGHRGIRFYNFLLERGRFDALFFEESNFAPHARNKEGKIIPMAGDGKALYNGLVMLMEMYAAGFGIPVYGVHPGTLKKDFTGNGRADKKEMCAAAHSLGWLGGRPGTELHNDECDACAVLITQLARQYGLRVSF